MALVLSRHRDEKTVIDLRAFGLGLVTLVIVEIRNGKVRLGIECDPKIPVHRQEVWDAIERSKGAA